MQKHQKAVKGLQQSREEHESLTATVQEEHVEEWTDMVASALRKRRLDPSAMDIYDVQMEKGGPSPARISDTD